MRTPIAGMMLASLLATLALSQDYKSRLAEAPSLSAIRGFCSKFETFGKLHEAEYKTQGAHLFMCWSQPDGSKVPSFLFGYVERRGKWQLVIDHPEKSSFAGSNVVVSVADDTVRLVSPSGETMRSYSLREASGQQ